MLPNIVTNQDIRRFINTAFTMILSVDTLEQYMSESAGCSISTYKQLMAQLKWLSNQHKNIVMSLLEDPNFSDHELLIKSLSTQMNSDLKKLESSLTDAILARQSLNTNYLVGKIHSLKLIIHNFYETLILI